MIEKNVSALKMMTKIGAALTILVAASACTHQQLKQEADASAIEETGAPTPDVSAESLQNDPLAAPTDIPGAIAAAPAAHRVTKAHAEHGKKHLSKKHAKARKVVAKKHRKAKTMIASGTVGEAQLPPPPTAPEVVAPEMIPAPAAPAVDAAALAASTDLGGGESTGGSHGLMILLATLGLGALAFAGVRIRKSRGSRRLVFN